MVYTKFRLLLFICLSISSFFFLSNFQTLKFFVTLFSGIVGPTKLKLGPHMNSQWMYHVYWNQDAAAYSSIGTHGVSGLMYRVYWNQAVASYSSIYFFIFLSLKFSNIKILRHIFLRNCEA